MDIRSIMEMLRLVVLLPLLAGSALYCWFKQRDRLQAVLFAGTFLVFTSSEPGALQWSGLVLMFGALFVMARRGWPTSYRRLK
jgi:hypothetical protein